MVIFEPDFQGIASCFRLLVSPCTKLLSCCCRIGFLLPVILRPVGRNARGLSVGHGLRHKSWSHAWLPGGMRLSPAASTSVYPQCRERRQLFFSKVPESGRMTRIDFFIRKSSTDGGGNQCRRDRACAAGAMRCVITVHPYLRSGTTSTGQDGDHRVRR